MSGCVLCVHLCVSVFVCLCVCVHAGVCAYSGDFSLGNVMSKRITRAGVCVCVCVYSQMIFLASCVWGNCV